ncbi:MAG: TIGR02281 family clan AA aspartic protease [Proteobacteria bacterium]|nr:TIGR02281 family clan AA aspartic protease [Pseudomonadota bacterium]
MTIRWITNRVVLSVLLFVWPLAAAEQLDIEVVALFADAAMLRIDGKQQLLKTGETSPEGVLLIGASSSEATIEYQGNRSTMPISERISSDFQKPGVVTLSVQINAQGQYIAMGSINGRPARFLIDTGANIVAMNSEMARSLGIDFSNGKKLNATTAGGTISSREVILGAVQVGEIKVTNVRGAVLEGEFPKDILLGMSFLKNVKIQKNAGLMVLTSQF